MVKLFGNTIYFLQVHLDESETVHVRVITLVGKLYTLRTNICLNRNNHLFRNCAHLCEIRNFVKSNARAINLAVRLNSAVNYEIALKFQTKIVN